MWFRCLTTILLLSCKFALLADEPQIRFKKHLLDADFRSEGATTGDFNKDGKLDVAAGFVWYAAPNWEMHKITEDAKTYDPKGYSNSFVNYAHDMNGDGWMDLIVIDFPGTPTWWFENPQNKPGAWKRHQVTAVSNNESPQFTDLTGDGQRELVMAFSPDPKNPDGPDRRMAYLTPRVNAEDEWTIHPISVKAAPGTRKYNHGLGIGDVNQDGRNDVLVPQGWWEAPDGYRAGEWKFHDVDFGEDCSHMYVYDFDGDGDQDVLSASAHKYGVWWHEQVNGQWVTHTIDDSFSQTHSVMLADVNGDGLLDFVTGKRWWAHGGADPGGNEPAVMFWFELKREQGRAHWVRHQFDHDSGVGTQFEVADVSGDGLLDIVTSNKKGVYYFEQLRN